MQFEGGKKTFQGTSKASFRRIISLPTSYNFSIKQLSSDGLLQLTENTGTNKFIL